MSTDYRHLCAELARAVEAFGDGTKRDWRGLLAMRRAVAELERRHIRDLDRRERALCVGMTDKCVCGGLDPEDGA